MATPYIRGVDGRQRAKLRADAVHEKRAKLASDIRGCRAYKNSAHQRGILWSSKSRKASACRRKLSQAGPCSFSKVASLQRAQKKGRPMKIRRVLLRTLTFLAKREKAHLARWGQVNLTLYLFAFCRRNRVDEARSTCARYASQRPASTGAELEYQGWF